VHACGKTLRTGQRRSSSKHRASSYVR
jgi:hypothetical protein